MKPGATIEVNSDRLDINGQRGTVTAVIDTPKIPTLYRVRVYGLKDRHGNPRIIHALRGELRRLERTSTSR